MNRKILVAIVGLFFFGCNSVDKNTSSIEVNQKMSDQDLFKNTMVQSQFFTIDNNKDNVIESLKGNLIIIEQGTFIDNNGQPVTNNVQVEFAEASDVDELILSNLVINDSNNNLEQNSSFYINATSNGEQLKINQKKPIYIELSVEKQPYLLKGNRDSLGNMKWEDEITSTTNLISVPFDLLNFYPINFEIEVEKGLPFKNHKIISKELCDSLYYSFSTELKENGHYNWNSFYNGLIMISLFQPLMNFEIRQNLMADSTTAEGIFDTAVSVDLCGINPASIKTIKTKKFENTLLSTREFEQRLKSIYKTCDNSILELYVNNLNKNLWEIDEMAAEKLGSNHKMFSQFKEYASYKQTTVMVSEKRAELLSNYYSKEKNKLEKDLLKIKKEYFSNEKKDQAFVEKKQEEYKQLLQKRLHYRMNKFGFELKNTGWYCAVRKKHINELEKFTLNTNIENGINFDRVYTYVINAKINSIFSLVSNDKTHFKYVFSDDPILLLWKNQYFDIISIGYKDNDVSYKIGNYQQTSVVNANLNLEPKTLKEFQNELRKYTRNYTQENKIVVDLEYQAFFYKQQQKKKTKQKELEYINNLRRIIFPCCNFSINTEFEIQF